MDLLLSNIKKQYGTHIVLEFERLEIGSGVYWLKGGNGTGKTTVFRIISGQTPFLGEVILNNISLKKKPIVYRAQISHADAEPQYPLFITGRTLTTFYKEIRGASESDVAGLAAEFEMEDFLDQKIGAYSSGMLKKLSLICAFLGNMKLYILDEPLITIDQASADKLYRLISEKVQQGCSFLLSSHQEIDQSKLAIDGIFEIAEKKIVSC